MTNGKHKDPTARAAIQNMSKSGARMQKALTVAQLTIELCMDELRRRCY